jgi:hypothetical protein
MRILATLILVSTISHAIAFVDPIDLNASGALESLQQRRPDHYARAHAILTLVESRPQLNLGSWIETKFKASDVEISQLWRVSDPPQLKVSFTLDQVRYTAVVVPVLARVRAVPA